MVDFTFKTSIMDVISHLIANIFARRWRKTSKRVPFLCCRQNTSTYGKPNMLCPLPVEFFLIDSGCFSRQLGSMP